MTGFFAMVAGYFRSNGEPVEIRESFERTAAEMRVGYRLLADTAIEGNRQLAAALGCRIVPPLEDAQLAAVTRPKLAAPKRTRRPRK